MDVRAAVAFKAGRSLSTGTVKKGTGGRALRQSDPVIPMCTIEDLTIRGVVV